ncbi:MAG: sigma factor-like helix-turn-helix DNA-binding protein [Anaerobutyricum sp.]
MAKASIHVTKAKTTTRTTARVAKSRNRSRGNPHKCPVCGNLWGVEKRMDKENEETRKKLKGISSVDEFRSILERTMLSDEEKKILLMHYKDKKSLTYIADELGMSEVTVKRKHCKILMKLGSVF